MTILGSITHGSPSKFFEFWYPKSDTKLQLAITQIRGTIKKRTFPLEKLFTKSSEYYKSTSRIMEFFKLALRITIPKCGARKETH